jgi:hypothetical protein
MMLRFRGVKEWGFNIGSIVKEQHLGVDIIT